MERKDRKDRVKNKITGDLQVKSALAGRHYLGEGLILRVRKTGTRDWALRITHNGKTTEYGLGSYNSTDPDHFKHVSLKKAQADAEELSKQIKLGLSDRMPFDKKPIIPKTPKLIDDLFETLAESYIDSHKAGWRSSKSTSQWHSSLKAYAYPTLGKLSVEKIETKHILRVLQPIWETKTETASRVRGRIEKILNYATTQGFRSGENPARWDGHLSTILPKRSKIAKVEHYAAMDYRELPAFWAKLAVMDGIGAAALKWTILNATRSGETRGATVDELDKDILWIIPSERMKAGKEHRVPLTKAAIACIPPRTDETNKLLFPARRGGKLSDMSISAVLRRMGIKDITVHGFRSTFRDWAGESTAHPREVIEHALAHQLKDKSEAAYARSDLLDKRRKLMEDWAKFVTGGSDER